MTRLEALTSTGGPEISLSNGEVLFAGATAADLTARFGSPLYVYSERILRERCREVMGFLPYRPSSATYSCKANTNVALLRVIREEGLDADAMSPGEIALLKAAGFEGSDIFYIGNNVDDAELRYAIDAGAAVSVDSIAQLRRFGRLAPGSRVAVRINPGIGDGHHKKVVTGGADAKFGVFHTDVAEIRAALAEYSLKLVGVNQHIGSNFMTPDVYLSSVRQLLSVAEAFDDLEFVDFGGGFGVPYASGERLDLHDVGAQMADVLDAWTQRYGKRIVAKFEPGRYVVCESGALLITVHATKQNPGFLFVGTDGGFNVLQRPVMYGSYHEILNSRTPLASAAELVPTNVCGNICESGDLLCEDRPLPPCSEGDVLLVLDAGAYGQSMSSNYNARLRPAEVLVTQTGELRLIRERDTLEDILRHQVG